MRNNTETLVDEVWLPVCGWEGFFVSNIGRIKCAEKSWASGRNGKVIKHIQEHIKVATLDMYGYPRVLLRNNGKNKLFTVHRLVATAFIPNPENKPQINHIDGNKENNSVDNLQWATSKENVNHAHATGLIKIPGGENARYKKLTLSAVTEIRNTPLKKGNVSSLAKKFNVCTSTINNVIKFKSWV